MPYKILSDKESDNIDVKVYAAYSCLDCGKNLNCFKN